MNNHWTEVETLALEKVVKFEEMVPVGVCVLERMRKIGGNIVMICGPMTTGGRGSLTANMEYFKKTQAFASFRGLFIFDQTPFEGTMQRLSEGHRHRKQYCVEILHIFYRQIFSRRLIDELMFLPDWASSTGASWERQEGTDLGLKISDYPREWLPFIED
ncbi:MAG: hypothetical protein A3G52_02440 [Candidatus Taylorbacteria bacterium RIFCSPLOWO2_12_FULL_43_20]|uniref:Uncharacterized protein n=1 Tax=Candidatus Taylorbacteria bacterium RIFCSPLOWO2_12_FULL_43_20 TaxID=1802332 RepID=A0A1G2P2H7_9BACT|nr:MAG: hypothetical protein A2825_00840 [Candidatus Taylorbacteria bacterium RIFCSPHIGHO2_01_FULL_43_120]OHA22202.1 MAG: hypothetical protein A3B98_02570 [Candidatus Taylorbacteria bacterium RIFCSPHIGHO2_02_FULL_43_55]OHA28305.1 MAG: hypothetical protein A3E92_01740 [Candidatus Taylorbacteria bacterium RIFCSPHIGHO2_12_FULL_42_34]OHA30325.1 MAG: hypothetical protein A3B09_03830 [Candidatus Taylorbacteria bacterium RIFCSPLOWO2_01_FULL_43_83]OHA37896.1 MAG: hypothetical protein A3H58_00410 [Candi